MRDQVVPFKRRRGTVAAITALLIVVLLGFTALAMDISWLVAAKHQLQVAADNCALSTAYFIANKPLSFDRSEVSSLAESYGHEFMPFNPVENIALRADNVKTGEAVWDAAGKVIAFNPSSTVYDAVRVIVTMSEGQRLPAFFGPVLGWDYYEPTARAVVLLSVRMGALLPFTIHRDYWADQMAAGRDAWKADNLDFAPRRVPNGDGIPELILYPENCGDEILCDPCAGNFGALQINRDNLGLPGFAGQIEAGITRNDLLFELDPQIGDYEVALNTAEWISPDGDGYDFSVGDFKDGSGAPVAEVLLGGDPGMSVGQSMREALRTRIGDIIGVFIHVGCDNGGANGLYHIVQIRYARLLGFKLTSGAKAITIQPTEEEPVLDGGIDVLGLGM